MNSLKPPAGRLSAPSRVTAGSTPPPAAQAHGVRLCTFVVWRHYQLSPSGAIGKCGFGAQDRKRGRNHRPVGTLRVGRHGTR